MPLDESSEEKPRVYREETDLDRPDKHAADIVGDDKADVSRMADDEEIAKTEPSTSSAHANKGARPTATNPTVQQLPLHGSLFGSNNGHKTGAFNAVSPSYITTVHPQAQMLHFAAAQQYYNGFWNYGNRLPSPYVASLTSPSLGSPSYGATLNGVGVYPSPHSWLSAFQLDAAAKAGFTYTPVVMGVPAQMSPSFPSPMDHLHMSMAFNARMDSPLFIPSPLHSPDTGAPIVTLGTKVPAPSLTALKLSLPNGGGLSNSLNASLGLSPSYVHHAANHVANPLMSMRQILVPPVTTTVTGVASSSSSSFATSLNGVCNSEIHRSTTDKQNSTGGGHSDGGNSLKRTTSSTDNNNQSTNNNHNHNNHHHHNHNSLSVLHRQKDSSSSSSSKKIHIKKPLNAFMLYMKEMRPLVMQEAGLKERQSAEINRILGRRWHSLTRDEQQKYYEMAKKERQEHLKKYPSWSARDNYAVHKKKKRKRDKAQDNLEAKKCRARFGLDQQVKWCKHCRRKKKCLWFKDGDGDSNDAADASPAAQVTSTSQFYSEDDCHAAPNSAESSTTTTTTKDGDINSPHSLVTSTTSHKRSSRPKKIPNGGAADDSPRSAEESSGDDDEEMMVYSEDEDSDATTTTISPVDEPELPPRSKITDNSVVAGAEVEKT